MAKKKDEYLLGVTDNTAQKLAEYQAGYKEGEKVQNAYNDYATLKNNAPQAYSSPYQAQLDNIYSKIVNRTPFKYSLNGDMLYQNAKEQYQQLGKQAMVDTIGQASALTGGYNNSYAQNVGNQAYQQYLLKLNEKIPEYYQLAMDRYNMEGDQLNNQYAMARDMEDQSYGRYRDTVSDYNNNLQMAYNIYGKERDNDYNQYADALNYWQNLAGAENKDYWTEQNFNYQKEQDALAQANWEREQALAEEKYRAEMAYKYAALAQQRAAAQQKAEEARQERISQKDLINQQKLNNGYKQIQISNGKTPATQSSTILPSVLNIAANTASELPPMDFHGIGGPAADISKIIEMAENNQANYSNDIDFLQDLHDTLVWEQEHKNLSEEQAKRVYRYFGLTDD